MAVDCCEHTLTLLRNTPATRLTRIRTKGNATNIHQNGGIDLIVIGAPRYPVRRPFISRLRELYPDVPILILRHAERADDNEDIVRGEFLLSDSGKDDDLRLVRSIRSLMPLKSCGHMHKTANYDTVRDLIRILSENYSDPDLSLDKVAKLLDLSASHLSRILNHDVGVSFRRLLRQTRIEEAKHLLASKRYSIKEVALRVGFIDSHYFSRTFKALTGQKPSAYSLKDAVLAE
jgi:AraC-like DNA-binding protein